MYNQKPKTLATLAKYAVLECFTLS